MELSKQAKNVLFHTLGYNYKDIPFRNHFVAGEKHSDFPFLIELENNNLMARGENGISKYFYATEKGKVIASKMHFSMKPKLSKSQMRYQRYLDLVDIIPDLTFKEFLYRKDLQKDSQ